MDGREFLKGSVSSGGRGGGGGLERLISSSSRSVPSEELDM